MLDFDLQRLWSKIEQPLEFKKCWIWKAGKYSSGYGSFTVNGVARRAHRLVYEQLIRGIPAGMTLDHICKVRACVNPFHLEVVTRAENTMRGEAPPAKNARKTHCKNGHELITGNLSIPELSRGHRICLTCRRLYDRNWKRNHKYGA